MRPRRFTFTWAVLLVTLVVVVVGFNLPGLDPDSVGFDAWEYDGHTRYGFPFIYLRVFDRPSPENATARFDPEFLAIDVAAWAAAAALLWLFPVAIRRVFSESIICQILNRREAERQGFGHCRSCGYDLTGNANGMCPECGSSVSA